MRAAFRRGLVFGVLVALGAFGLAGCGDVTSELITGATGGAAGSPGGASMGGTSAAAGMSGASMGGAGAGGATGGSGGTPECTPETAETDCTSGERILCHPGSQTCVECVYNGHCDPEEDCSEVLGECAVTCTSAADCTDDDNICDMSIGFCVECLIDTDCPSGEQCSRGSCD
jgi:hypothetical protein